VKVSVTLLDRDGRVVREVGKMELRDLPVVGCLNMAGLHGKVVITNEGA